MSKALVWKPTPEPFPSSDQIVSITAMVESQGIVSVEELRAVDMGFDTSTHMLTQGACRRLFGGDTDFKPTVQVIDVKEIASNNGAASRHRLVISDGEHYMQAMLATQLNDLVEGNQLAVHCVIKLSEMISNQVQARKIVILLAVEVVQEPTGSKIGNPQNIEQAGAAPVQQQCLSNNAPSNNNNMNNRLQNNGQQQQQQQQPVLDAALSAFPGTVGEIKVPPALESAKSNEVWTSVCERFAAINVSAMEAFNSRAAVYSTCSIQESQSEAPLYVHFLFVSFGEETASSCLQELISLLPSFEHRKSLFQALGTAQRCSRSRSRSRQHVRHLRAPVSQPALAPAHAPTAPASAAGSFLFGVTSPLPPVPTLAAGGFSFGVTPVLAPAAAAPAGYKRYKVRAKAARLAKARYKVRPSAKAADKAACVAAAAALSATGWTSAETLADLHAEAEVQASAVAAKVASCADKAARVAAAAALCATGWTSAEKLADLRAEAEVQASAVAAKVASCAATAAASGVVEWTSAAKQAGVQLAATAMFGAPARVVVLGFHGTENVTKTGIYSQMQGVVCNSRPAFKLVLPPTPTPAAATTNGSTATENTHYLFSARVPQMVGSGADYWCIGRSAPEAAPGGLDYFSLDGAIDPTLIRSRWHYAPDCEEISHETLLKLRGRDREALAEWVESVVDAGSALAVTAILLSPAPAVNLAVTSEAVPPVDEDGEDSEDELLCEPNEDDDEDDEEYDEDDEEYDDEDPYECYCDDECACPGEQVPSARVHTIEASSMPIGLQRLVRTRMRKKNTHRVAMLMKRLTVEESDGLLVAWELDWFRRRLLDAVNGAAIGVIQAESMARVATAAGLARKQADREEEQLAEKNFDRILGHPDTEQLKIRLQWDAEQPKAYAALLVQLSQTVGLSVVKTHVREQVTDAMGRKTKGESMRLRHVVISGDFGTGKRTAAELVARLGKVLGEVDANCGTRNAGTQLSIIDNFKTHLQMVNDPPCGKTCVQSIDIGGISKKSVYYLRVSSGSPKPKNSTDSPILDKMSEYGSVLIVAGEKQYIDDYCTLDAFRRREPHMLQLPPISATNLAKITAKLVRARGYHVVPPAFLGRKLGLGGVGSSASAREENTAIAVMRFVIRQRFNAETIKLRNAHLAADMLDKAIARKNDRSTGKAACSTKAGSHESDPLTLFDGAFDCVGAGLAIEAEDFDVTLPDRELRDARRREIDLEIESMIGWGGSDVANSPKAFFESARRVMLRQEKELAEGESSEQTTDQLFNWNVVVTGTPGTGKTSFARLLHKFCFAYGALKKDILVECSGLELKGQYVGQSGPKVQQMFEAAKGGSLFIDEAYALAGIGEAGNKGNDSFSVEAVRTMLTELENHRSSVVCVLAGYKDKMGRLLRADSGLQSRFPYRVEISDYSASQLAQITQRYAEKKGFVLEPMLIAVDQQTSASMLAAHLKITYGDDKSAGNGRLAINLVEGAIQKRAFRIDQKQESQEREEGQEGTEQQEGTAQQQVLGQCLLAIDFEIGSNLADGKADLKAAVDAELQALVGMDTAKEWFKTLKNKVWLADQTGDRSILSTCMHMVITGNPGTGKTTFTRLLFRFLYAYGILSKDTFVEKNGQCT
jgi:Holliday junction resolvasome RuvABC ATP-dependent DNA helicase subunit